MDPKATVSLHRDTPYEEEAKALAHAKKVLRYNRLSGRTGAIALSVIKHDDDDIERFMNYRTPSAAEKHRDWCIFSYPTPPLFFSLVSKLEFAFDCLTRLNPENPSSTSIAKRQKMSQQQLSEGYEEVPISITVAPLKVKVMLRTESAKLPTLGSSGAAGFDLYSAVELVLQPRAPLSTSVPTGVSFEIPKGFVGQIFSRSGLAVKCNIHVGAGTIDSDYRGEVFVCLRNESQLAQTIMKGDRIAQILFIPVPEVELILAEKLGDTTRGEGGFGSTGSA